MIETIYSNPNELYHHGVKGMKWGVRRYQNEDGTRTTRGKIHEKLQSVDKKKAAAHAIGTAATVAGVIYTAKNPEKVASLIKTGAKATGKTLATAVKEGSKDAAKVLVTGGLIYAGEQLIDLQKGQQAANKVIQYGRQPQKKK